MSMEVSKTPIPGKFIKEELHERGWTQDDLANMVGCSEQTIKSVLSGKRSISFEMAEALGKAFNVSPEFFINLQKAYDKIHYVK